MMTRATQMGAGLLLLAASAAWLIGQATPAWSILLAGLWTLANAWVIAGLCRAAFCARPQRRWRRLAGYVAVKFPVLYGLGYLCVTAWRPSAAGLTIGLTLGLAALLISAARQEAIVHGPPASFGASAGGGAPATQGRQADAAHAFDIGTLAFGAASAGKRWGDG